MATIVISLVLLVMAVEEGSSGWFARFNILGTEAKEQASALAEGCAEQAQAALLTDPNYGYATTTIMTSGGTCHVFPVQFNFPIAGLVTIKTQAVVRNSYANLDMAMNMNDIHFGSIPTTPTTGTLFITTHVNNDSSGTKQAGDFTMNVSANPSSSFVGSESGTVVTVQPGVFSVNGNILPNYLMSNVGDCSGSIIAGEIKFCTINYDDITTTLTVIANVVNNDTGTKQPGDFPLFIDGTTVTLGQRITVTAGTHTVSATLLSGYAASAWGYDCAAGGNITMTLGQNKTCIINFDDIPPPTPVCAETIMMLDRSCSMFSTCPGYPTPPPGSDQWIPDEKTAAKSLIDLYSGVTPNPKMGVGRFGDIATGLSAEIFSQLSTAYAAMKSAIDNGLPLNSGPPQYLVSYTNLADAITKSNDELNSTRHVPGKEKVLILVSDGEPNEPTGTVNSSVTLVPNAEGTSTAWSANTGTKVAAVASDDDDTTYITPAVMAETYKLANANIPADAMNISVTLHAVAKRASGTTASIALMAENGLVSALDGGHTLSGSYVDVPWTMNSNPLGGAWTVSEVNGWSTKFGVLNTSASGNVPRVTQIYAVVSYTIVTSNNIQKAPTSASAPNQWTNPTRAFASDNSYATDSTNGHQQGYSNFGFAIPSGATIQGIQITTEAKISGTASPRDTLTLYPSGQGSQTAWTNGEATIDETGTPNCSSGDSIYTGTTNNRESATIDLSSIPDGSTITSVDVTAYDKADSFSGGTYKTFVRLNGSNFDAASSLSATATGGSSICSSAKTQSINFSSTVKSPTTILEVGVVKVSGNSNVVRVGAINAVITFIPPSIGALDIALSSNNGGTWTSAETVNVGTSEAVASPSGNSSADLWGRTWVSSDFNNGNFVFRVQNDSTNGVTVSLDQVTVNVFYTVTANFTTSSLVPVSIGSYNNWPPNTGTVLTAVNQNDGDSTYISNTPATLGAETFIFPNANIPSGATNIQITLHAVAEETNGSSGNIRLVAEKGASQPTDGGHNLTGSYVDYSWQMTNNPLGGSWTAGEVNGWTTRFGVKDNSTSGTIPRVTQIYLLVNYTVTTDPTTAAYAAADAAKLSGTDIFTIHFGDTAGRDLLARLASGTTPNPPHQNGSYSDASGVVNGDTGNIAPSQQAADTGGHGDGFEVNPTFAYTDNDSPAVNANGAGDRHRYYGYNIVLPPNANVTGISVTPNWWLDSTSGTNSLGVELSYNGGANWTSAKTDTNESTSHSHTATLGGSADLWGRTSWSAADFSQANFRVRVTANCSGSSSCNSRHFYLDYLPVRVYYTVIQENSDGDNFFISPTSADMEGIFHFIGEQVCPAILNVAPPPPPTTGTLIVMTQVVNNNGGSKAASDFTVNVSADTPSQTSFAGSATGVSITVNPGAYNITENNMAGYTQSPGATCSSAGSLGSIVAGETRVCIITNDDIPPPPPPPNLNLDVNSWHEIPTSP